MRQKPSENCHTCHKRENIVHRVINAIYLDSPKPHGKFHCERSCVLYEMILSEKNGKRWVYIRQNSSEMRQLQTQEELLRLRGENEEILKMSAGKISTFSFVSLERLSESRLFFPSEFHRKLNIRFVVTCGL